MSTYDNQLMVKGKIVGCYWLTAHLQRPLEIDQSWLVGDALLLYLVQDRHLVRVQVGAVKELLKARTCAYQMAGQRKVWLVPYALLAGPAAAATKLTEGTVFWHLQGE